MRCLVLLPMPLEICELTVPGKEREVEFGNLRLPTTHYYLSGTFFFFCRTKNRMDHSRIRCTMLNALCMRLHLYACPSRAKKNAMQHMDTMDDSKRFTISHTLQCTHFLREKRHNWLESQQGKRWREEHRQTHITYDKMCNSSRIYLPICL